MKHNLTRYSLIGIVLIALTACQTTEDMADGESAPDFEQQYRDKISNSRNLARVGNYDLALEILDGVISDINDDDRQLSPETVLAAHYYRGLVQNDLRRPEDAEADFEIAARIASDSDVATELLEKQIWDQLGRARGSRGDYLAALEAFEMALSLNDANEFPDPRFAVEMHRLRSFTFQQVGDSQNAIVARENIIAVMESTDIWTNEEKGRTYLQLSISYRNLSRWIDSAEAARLSVELLLSAEADANSIATAYYFHAVGLSQGGIEDGYLEAYLSAMQYFRQSTNPNFEYLGVASFNVGNYYQLRGKPAIAEEYFVQAEAAYEHMVQTLESRERQAPGSVPPQVLSSFRFRLNDTRQRINQMRLMQR